jgi:hypothetical protein
VGSGDFKSFLLPPNRPYYFRLGPHTVITFIIMEQLNTAYNKYAGITGGSSL